MAFLQLAEGRVIMPVRSKVEIPEANGVVLLMPCYAAGTHRVSAKLLTQFADNGRLGLPLIQAVVLLADAVNGRLLAVVDGSAITALRTGAASGVATRLLASPSADTAAILGAGVQARTQLEAVCAVRQIRQVRVFDCCRPAAEAFVRDMSSRLGIPVLATSSATEALAGAQIVCTATTPSTPVFEDRDLAAGVHIHAVGSWRPWATVRSAAFVQAEESVMSGGSGRSCPFCHTGVCPCLSPPARRCYAMTRVGTCRLGSWRCSMRASGETSRRTKFSSGWFKSCGSCARLSRRVSEGQHTAIESWVLSADSSRLICRRADFWKRACSTRSYEMSRP